MEARFLCPAPSTHAPDETCLLELPCATHRITDWKMGAVLYGSAFVRKEPGEAPLVVGARPSNRVVLRYALTDGSLVDVDHTGPGFLIRRVEVTRRGLLWRRRRVVTTHLWEPARVAVGGRRQLVIGRGDGSVLVTAPVTDVSEVVA